jgi:hypothetical protein
MAIRYYPSPEGYVGPDGQPYADQPEGSIRAELNNWLETLKRTCHENAYFLDITSLNHGVHVENSMHGKGLACDFNIRDAHGYLSFQEQSSLAADAVNSLRYDAWIWSDDLNTHTHISIHPQQDKGEAAKC